MRPIDADSLIEKYGKWYIEEGTEEGFIGTLKSLLDNDAPTVDAISMSWLIAWAFKRYMETQREITVSELIEAWYKEQEVR